MVGDVLDEHRRDVLGLDLADDLGHVLRRSLALGAHTLWRDDLQPIGGAEIAKASGWR